MPRVVEECAQRPFLVQVRFHVVRGGGRVGPIPRTARKLHRRSGSRLLGAEKRVIQVNEIRSAVDSQPVRVFSGLVLELEGGAGNRSTSAGVMPSLW